ncbi:MAG: tetratricopeptide repeat protein [Bacteroidales bacterium]|nr:tetratricopeptide repeat protein [Bacteroidales bacterium]
MTTTISDTTIQALRAYLLAHLGLSYSKSHEKDLARKIEYAAKEFGYSNPARFVEWLLQNKLTDQQTGVLASHLTIGETYFLREKKSFDFLEQIYLPGLIQKRYGADKRLRVWCAGCATGEEAYSLAIVLIQSIPDISGWDISILATDINSVFLEKAKKGIFTKWSFRNNPEQFVGKYFTKEGPNEFHILPRIKKMVTFAQLNLAEEGYPSILTGTEGIDIIFCRNVLIYFSPEGTRALTDRLYESLLKGGILVVSPVEMSGMISPKFGKINYAGFTIYQKGVHSAEEKQHFNWETPSRKPEKEEPLPAAEKEPVKYLDDQSELNRLKKLLPEEPIRKISPPSDKDFEDALFLFQQNDFAEADSILSRLIKKDSINGKTAITLLARTKANLGKLKEAGELCERAIQLDKLNPALHYLMATVMHEQGNDEKAINLLNRSVYLDYDFTLAWFLLGNLWMRAGNYESGKKSYKQAMISLAKLPPDDILPESDGITVERFKEILNAIT